MDRNYKNIIWTNHAIKRMRERGIKQSDAWATWRNPQKSRYAKVKSAWIYNRIINGENIEVVAKKNEEDDWVILSVWSKQTQLKPKESKENSYLLKIMKRLSGVACYLRFNKK